MYRFRHSYVMKVRQGVELTVAFHVKLAWAKAEGNIHYWK